MDEARWDLFFRLGMEAYNSGDWNQAIQAFEVTLDEARSLPEPDLRLARSLNNLACSLGNLGRQVESIALQEEALRLTQKLLGDDHELVAGSYLNLASDYAKLERFAEAEALFQEALRRLEKLGQPQLYAQGLENFSQFYLSQQKLPEAVDVLQALAKLQADQPEPLARCLHTLTHIYDALGQTEAADASRAQALEIIEKLWGSHTLAYGEVVANMAESLMAQQRNQEAAAFFKRAAASFAACVPQDDPRWVGCLLGQLICLRDSGQLELASQLGREVLETWQAHHPEMRRWLNEFGLIAFLAKNYEEAASVFERSMQLPGDLPMPTRISILFNLGSAHMGAGDHQKSLLVLESCADLAEEHLPTEHQLTERIWLQLQELYRLTQQPQKELAIQEKLNRATLRGS